MGGDMDFSIEVRNSKAFVADEAYHIFKNRFIENRCGDSYPSYVESRGRRILIKGWPWVKSETLSEK
jgi:hypothetical protein